jgi:hypothetical protein
MAIDEYGAMVEWVLAGENLFHCYFVHYKSHMKSLRIGSEAHKNISFYKIHNFISKSDPNIWDGENM